MNGNVELVKKDTHKVTFREAISNERLLYEILNDVYPKQWVSEYKGIEAKGIYQSGPNKGKEYTRRFSFDCANPTLKIAIEIDGGIWLGKGHTGGLHYQSDMEKQNLATIEGWRMLRYTPDTLKKTPWKLIKDVRMLCGASDECQQTLSLDGMKQANLQQVQVHIT